MSLFTFISLSYCNYSYAPSSGAPAATTAESAQQAGASQGSLEITLDYTKQSGSASNQFAIWIEDANHEYVKTLYATRYTANGGYKVRPDSIYEWVEKSGLAGMSEAEVDAVSGATPGPGTQTYIWDLTDAGGTQVQDGGYFFLVEGTLRWKNRVLFTGYVEIGGEAASFEPEPSFTFEGAGGQPALDEDSPEANMLAAVTARYTPGAAN